MKIQLVELLKNKLKFFQQRIRNDDYKWLKENMSRNEAESYLKDKLVGTFIVRKSETHLKSYVLSVKVPIYANSTTYSHYLIECKKRKKYSLKGIDQKFSNVNRLVKYYSKNRDILPVLLNLNYE